MKPCLVFFKCVLYALVSLSLFIACTDNVSLKTEWQEAKEEKLLSDFVDKHSDLLETFFVKYSLAETKSVKNEDIDYLCDAIRQNLENVFSKCGYSNVYVDGTRCLSEDSLDILKLDSELLLAYIKVHNSDLFYSSYRQILETGTMVLQPDEIISEDELYFNEKLFLLFAYPILEQQKVEASMTVSTRASNPCLSAYQSSRNECTVNYLASCAVSFIIPNPISTPAGVALATYQYNQCMDNAHSAYIRCQNG